MASVISMHRVIPTCRATEESAGVAMRIRSAAPLDCGRHAAILVFGYAIASASFSVSARGPVNAGDPDPADRKALVAVCGKCHKVGLFDKSIRSEPDWRDTLQTMV